MGIRDQGYTSYEGDLTQGQPPAWVIATNDLRLYWAHRRTKLLFIALMFATVPFVIAGVAERAVLGFFRGADPSTTAGMVYYGLGYLQVWMVVALFAASGCGVIADDIRHKTIQIYFAKPLRVVDYAVGKFLSLFLLGSLVVAIPTAIVGGLRTAVYAPTDQLQTVLRELGGLVAYDIAMLTVLSLVVMALSCVTTRSGLVVLALLGVILIPSMAATTVDLIVTEGDWPELLSLPGSLSVALKNLVGFEGLTPPAPPSAAPDADQGILAEHMTWGPWLALAAVSAACAGVVRWRLSKLDGIA